MAKALSALLKGVSKEPIRRVFQYHGEDIEFYSTVLTLKQREKVKSAQRDAEDSNEFALKLLIEKACDKDGKRMFQAGQYAELLNEWPIAALESAMLLMLKDETGNSEEDDVKN